MSFLLVCGKLSTGAGLFTLLFFSSFAAFAQQRILQVVDRQSRIPIGYANVQDIDKQVVKTTDESGFCTIIGKPGVLLLISRVGYRDTLLVVPVTEGRLLVAMSPIELQQIDVFAGERFDRKVAQGVNNVPLTFLKSVPNFIGEPDIIKSLTLLPGVSEGREGYSHLFVRGGDQDQNLMLLDGATLFNINHFGGFISMFNADVLGSVDFYKNSWPSKFGGRASSVMDIRTAEGNYREHKRSYQFGVVAPKFSASGPIWKDRIAYHVGIRRTFLDVFSAGKAARMRSGQETGDIANLVVQDVNIRLDAKIRDNQHFSISVLHGRDRYAFLENHPVLEQAAENRYTIQNEVLAFNYRWHASSKTSLYAHASYSSYRHNYEDIIEGRSLSNVSTGGISLGKMRMNSGNDVQSFKVNVHGQSRFQHRLTLKYGLENEMLNDAIFLHRSESYSELPGSDFFKTAGTTGARITSGFAEFEYGLTDRFDLNGGLRVSHYAAADFNTVLTEPKLLLRYKLDARSTVNAAYGYHRQTVGLIAFTDNMGRFREYYALINRNMLPLVSKQFSAGYFRSMKGFFSNFSVELFYKEQIGISRFIPSVDYLENVLSYPDYLHRNGHLETYGAEFLLQKGYGVFQGSLSYTYMRSSSRFPTINKGRAFDSDFDFRHSANLLLFYTFGKGYRLSGSWTYKTGRPFTLPTSHYEISDGRFGFPVYADINNVRMPAFHRLDINLERRWNSRKGNNRWFGIGVYNVYNRVNPFFAQPDYQSGKLEVVGLFPIIPFFYIGFER